MHPRGTEGSRIPRILPHQEIHRLLFLRLVVAEGRLPLDFRQIVGKSRKFRVGEYCRPVGGHERTIGDHFRLFAGQDAILPYT